MDKPLTAAAHPERLLYPKVEAAYMLGLSVRKVEYLVSSGDLKSRVVHGRRLFHVDELKKFARADHPRRSAAR